MGLDYTSGCVNFRDAGAFINLIMDRQIFKEGKIYRGGSIDHVKDHKEIGLVRSIISLRNGPDSNLFEASYYHFPMSNKIEKYDTSQKEVRVWLNQIVSTFTLPDFEFPVLIHCLSGKDRTGIVIAALLLIMGIDQKTITEEYLLSEGDVRPTLIDMAMEGMKHPEKYFNRVNLDYVRNQLKNHLLLKDQST